MPEERSWEQCLAAVAACMRTYGHARILPEHADCQHLRRWVLAQRRSQRKGSLSAARYAQLEAIGFEWHPAITRRRHLEQGGLDPAWEARFQQLRALQEQHGHTCVPTHRGEDKPLGQWATRQRRLRRQGKLRELQLRRLNEIGFEWNPPPRRKAGVIYPSPPERRQSKARFAELLAFKERHGHMNVPGICHASRRLVAWMWNLRRRRKAGQLSAERIAKLDAVGFEWQPSKRQRGAVIASPSPIRSKPRHGQFMTHAGQSIEPPDIPESHTARWERRYAELAAFHAKHGHLGVRLKNQTSPGLIDWLHHHRVLLREGRLNPEWQARLTALGYEWEVPVRLADRLAKQNDDLWEKQFGQLVAYQQKHGDCQVSAHWRENPSLGWWVRSQRKHYKHGQLGQDRQARLEQIGFAWKSAKRHYTEGWEGRYAELMAFKEKHGHLQVTKSNQTSPGFMHWRDNQRINLHNGTLTPEHKARLDALGFEWQPPRQSRPQPQNYLPKDSITR